MIKLYCVSDMKAIWLDRRSVLTPVNHDSVLDTLTKSIFIFYALQLKRYNLIINNQSINIYMLEYSSRVTLKQLKC